MKEFHERMIDLSEKIIPVDLVEQHNRDTIEYSTYVALKRVIPDLRDGLKTVHRRIIHTMYSDLHKTPTSSYTKTARVVGAAMGLYHPHGDAAIAESMKPMTNDFECKVPYLDGLGTWGDPLGLPMASQRYTETRLSEYAYDCILGELKETKNATDWELNYSGECKEPMYFPSIVPNLLINGAYGIASGLSVDIPRHNFAEVIDATIKLIKNPNAEIVLIPDNCMPTDIIDTDWKTICRTGRGKYRVRSKVEVTEYEKKPALKVTSVPDMAFFDKIREKINSLMVTNKLPQIDNILDLSDGNNMLIFITLKKGADPNYVRDLLFNSTMLELGRGVNFEVLVGDGIGVPVPKLISYKEYLLDFIEFRRLTKFRIYCNRVRDARTANHKMELYIRALESGEIDKIIKMIRAQKGTNEDEYIEYLIKKLDVTDVQAKFLLSTDLKKLSPGYLNYYKQKRDEYLRDYEHCFDMLNNPQHMEEEIIQELLAAKAKYKAPRMSRVISVEEASNIPEGMFQVVITNKNNIRKYEVGANITGLGGEIPVSIFVANNIDSVLIFTALGKVYKLPISVIPFNFIDIRKILKNLTSDIVSIIMESSLKEFAKSKNNFVYTISRNGFLKRMACDEFINTPPSGIIYAKLEEGDGIIDVIFMNVALDLVVYSKNKALRIPGSSAPQLMRSTKGNYAMNSKYPMTGINCIYPDTTGIVTVTKNGFVNRVSVDSLAQAKRAQAGQSVIGLHKDDEVIFMSCCREDQILNLYSGVACASFPINSIEISAGISKGKRLVKKVVDRVLLDPK